MALARKLTSRGICIQEIGASYEPILVTKSQIKSPASEGVKTFNTQRLVFVIGMSARKCNQNIPPNELTLSPSINVLMYKCSVLLPMQGLSPGEWLI